MTFFNVNNFREIPVDHSCVESSCPELSPGDTGVPRQDTPVSTPRPATLLIGLTAILFKHFK